MKMIFCFIVNVLLFSQFANGKTKHSEGHVVEIKKHGAVTSFSKEDGFKLSQKAMNNLGVEFNTVKGAGPWTIPKSALVRVKHSTGVYRKWDGWITMVLVKIIKQTDKTVTIKSVDLEDQDLVAVAGVSFLRMTESDLNSDTVDTCSH